MRTLAEQIREDMTHARGRSPARLNRTYPYQVEIIVPDTGLEKRLNEMISFADRIGENIRLGKDIKSSLPREVDATRFCFASVIHADLFQAEYGGKRVTKDSTLRLQW